ncbi:hypothetical protein [uncultured Chryseobacterium sp.]|uniref:hypothetical protein n=1 Tax=uncultured Chryseobacterium sp. TaxID=259322 RepID=UPI0025EFB3DC|nr:hypothetical protein [uncultured Chryseobacterium sp.]
MKLASEINKINEILSEYDSNKAKIWLFDISHIKIAIKIFSAEDENIIYLVAAGCKYIKGFFSLQNPKFSIIQYFSEENLETEFKIIDVNSDFELIATVGVALAKGIETEFGDSFENFLREN